MNKTLLDETLAVARCDGRTVNPRAGLIEARPDGMQVRDSKPIVDDRGSLFEIYRTDWGIHDAPVDQVYAVTIRPGVAKGWALHKRHEDRYFIISGDMNLVLYDVRPDSPTCGEVFTLSLSGSARRLVTVPANVWHADHNIGSTDVLLLNMPTVAYDYANPDKFRLPLDSPLIPYRFPAGVHGS